MSTGKNNVHSSKRKVCNILPRKKPVHFSNQEIYFEHLLSFFVFIMSFKKVMVSAILPMEKGSGVCCILSYHCFSLLKGRIKYKWFFLSNLPPEDFFLPFDEISMPWFCYVNSVSHLHNSLSNSNISRINHHITDDLVCTIFL